MKAALAINLALILAVYWTGVMASGDHLPRLSPETARALEEGYEEHWEAEDAKAALKPLLRLLAANPDNHNYLSRQAKVYHELKDFKREAGAWELYMTVAPDPTDACQALGRAYKAMGLAEKAVQAYERCFSIDSTQSDLKFFLAHANERRDRVKAERLYLEILAESPGYSDAALGLARIRLSQNRDAEAEKLILTVLQKSKNNSDALLSWAYIADRKGDREQAKARVQQAIAASPAYADLYRVLGQWYERDKDAAGALRVYTTLKELEPQNAIARAKVEKYKKAAR